MSPVKQLCCEPSVPRSRVSRTEIPAPIQDGLERTGGFEGLIARVPAKEILIRQSRIHHALSDPVRLTILNLLKDQPLCVCVIKSIVNIADSRLSYHLNILKEHGLISAKAQGNWIIYRITGDGQKHLNP